MKLKWLYPNVLSISFVIIGAALMCLTLKYRVNPVEGSVVEPAVRGTLLHWILLFTTMPAWIAGVFVSDKLFGNIDGLAIVSMFFFQILLYHLVGKLANLIVAYIRPHRWKSGKSS